MKRFLISVAALLTLATSTHACPPPTPHFVGNIGATYNYALPTSNWTLDNLGIDYTAGLELPRRFVTLSVAGNYIFRSHTYQIGGQININPLGAYYGYATPVNFSIFAGAGYSNNGGAYINTGIEMNARMGNYFAPYAKVDFRTASISDTPAYSIELALGIRLWLGKNW